MRSVGRPSTTAGRPGAARPVGILLVAVVALTGCGVGGSGDLPASTGSEAAVAEPTGSGLPALPPASVTPARPPASGAELFCAGHPDTAETVRTLVVPAIEDGPKLPAAMALLLIGPRDRAAAVTVDDPALEVARAELVAALDDIAVQGQQRQPTGGSGQEAVQFDPARLSAAVDEVERRCATR